MACTVTQSTPCSSFISVQASSVKIYSVKTYTWTEILRLRDLCVGMCIQQVWLHSAEDYTLSGSQEDQQTNREETQVMWEEAEAG